MVRILRLVSPSKRSIRVKHKYNHSLTAHTSLFTLIRFLFPSLASSFPVSLSDLLLRDILPSNHHQAASLTDGRPHNASHRPLRHLPQTIEPSLLPASLRFPAISLLRRSSPSSSSPISATLTFALSDSQRRLSRILMSAATRSTNVKSAFSYCIQQVRKYDYQHYLCLLELPPEMRKAAVAIRAFNVETAKVMDIASDPRIGLMRLVWWRDTIDKIIQNKLVEHPIASALSEVIAEHKLSKAWLKRSVDARIKDAQREPGQIIETLTEVEKYAEDTQSTLLYLTLQAGGIKSTVADHAASHIGKACGILLLIRSLPYHVSKQREFAYIPLDIAEKSGLLIEQRGRREISLESREGLCNAVFEMASVANAHLQKARELANTVPADAVPVLLPAVPAQVLLDSLNRVNFDVYDPRFSRGILGIPPLWFQLKLKWSSWRGHMRPEKGRQCYNCGDPGHMRPECTRPLVTCFTCGRQGHRAVYCRQGGAASQQGSSPASVAGGGQRPPQQQQQI